MCWKDGCGRWIRTLVDNEPHFYVFEEPVGTPSAPVDGGNIEILGKS
jgi:hypothetical protein